MKAKFNDVRRGPGNHASDPPNLPQLLRLGDERRGENTYLHRGEKHWPFHVQSTPHWTTMVGM